MTDTDKLKRLALHLADEAILLSMGPNPVSVQRANEAEDNSRVILALIAERDEAVALLMPLANMATVCGRGGDDSVYVGQSGIRLTYGDFRRAFALLARIDGNHQPASDANPA